MKEYPICPKCGQNKCRIIKGVCQFCYINEYTKLHRKRKYPSSDKIIITDLQKEFISGCLLGDGCISNIKYGRKSPSFGIDRMFSDIEYARWQYSFIQNLCSRDLSIRDRYNKTTQKTHKCCTIQTRYIPQLLEIRNLWYLNEIKIIPTNLKLTKLIMQIWYCDDGSLEKFNSGSFRIKFSTHGFSIEENMFLIDLLNEKYNIKSSLHKDKDKFKICINSNYAPIVFDDLKKDFPNGMQRKLL